MDLQVYYQNIRELEASIPGEFAVIVSLKTRDGGKADVMSEVSKSLAARAVVENWARLATGEEASTFHKRKADSAAAARQTRTKSGKE